MERLKPRRYSSLPEGDDDGVRVARMARSRSGRFSMAAFFILIILRALYINVKPTLKSFNGAQIVPGTTWPDVRLVPGARAHGDLLIRGLVGLHRKAHSSTRRRHLPCGWNLLLDRRGQERRHFLP